MFVLDTNILSAIMSARPSPEVAAWIAGQPEDALFTTTICQAEILAGLAVMPEGRRRVALETAARAIFADDFNGRVLPFDAAAARDRPRHQGARSGRECAHRDCASVAAPAP